MDAERYQIARACYYAFSCGNTYAGTVAVYEQKRAASQSRETRKLLGVET